MATQQYFGFLPVVPLCRKPGQIASLQPGSEQDAGNRNHWDNEGKLIDEQVSRSLQRFRQLAHALQYIDIHQGDEDTAADNGYAAEGLHGDMHGFAVFEPDWLSI